MSYTDCMAVLGAISLILLFLLCHALSRLYYFHKSPPPPPPPVEEKAEEKRVEVEPVYYIVEKKTRKKKPSYGEPKQIKFD